MDYFFLFGESMDGVVKRYRELTGRSDYYLAYHGIGDLNAVPLVFGQNDPGFSIILRGTIPLETNDFLFHVSFLRFCGSPPLRRIFDFVFLNELQNFILALHAADGIFR